MQPSGVQAVVRGVLGAGAGELKSKERWCEAQCKTSLKYLLKSKTLYLSIIAAFVFNVFTPVSCCSLLLGEESDWRKCDSVARILVTCPQQSASADSYYKKVCPQVCCSTHTHAEEQFLKDLPAEFVQKLCASLPRRTDTVLKATPNIDWI